MEFKESDIFEVISYTFCEILSSEEDIIILNF